MMKTMLQQVMISPGQIEFHEVPVPDPKTGEVLIKIMNIGICGSDIHVYHGKHPFTSYPVTQGHEVSGLIEKIGEGTTGFTIGQKVTVQPQVVCGECYPCRHGKYNLCEKLKVMGFQTTGMASQYFALAKAKEVGVEACINTKTEDFATEFIRYFGPDKADVIYDCAGNNITMNQAIRSARKGSVLILVAVFDGMATVDLAVLNDHELSLNTSMMYRNEDYQKAIELVSERKVQLKPLISKKFSFQQYQSAYKYIDENRESTMKVIVDMQPEKRVQNKDEFETVPASVNSPELSTV